jgi:hypothetical protein
MSAGSGAKIQIRLLTEKEVVTLLEANEVVQPLEFGTALWKTSGLCGNCHDGDVLAKKAAKGETGKARKCCV